MLGTALGHRLETLNEGLTTLRNGEPAPLPLVNTGIHVQVLAGAAVVKTTRHFRNAEQSPIEAIMTFPVGFDSVVTGLFATIDGRRMVAAARGKAQARESYETGLDKGQMSVLHEEVLRGIHILSVGSLPAGAEVVVELEQVIPMTNVGGKQFLRLPMTSGQLYGTSPLLPADDLVASDRVRHEATLTVTSGGGRVYFDGSALEEDTETVALLDKAIELTIEGGAFGILQGRAADGRAVSLSFTPQEGHAAPLDLHVLVDRSGSTNSLVRKSEGSVWQAMRGGMSVWQAMRDGLNDAFATFQKSDRVSLWQFDNSSDFLGSANGKDCVEMLSRLTGPRGGTELSGAVRSAIAHGAQDILVLTDGQTWAHIVDDLKGHAVRISAIFVGSGSLDANIGHLCALTGGQVFYAPGEDVSSPLKSAFDALRTRTDTEVGSVGAAGPERVMVRRGGVAIEATWTESSLDDNAASADAIGRFAAALAIPMLDANAAETWASTHSLCTHLTSLVLVDEGGEVSEGFSQMRKIPIMGQNAGLMRSAYHFASYDHFANESQKLSTFRPSVLRAHRVEERSAIDAGLKRYRPTQAHGPKTKGSWLARLRARLVTLDQAAELVTSFETFAWDKHGDSLIAGDFSTLSRDQRFAVDRILQALRRKGAKKDRHLALELLQRYTLGLIAQESNDRLAARFARRALNDAPDWVRGHTM